MDDATSTLSGPDAASDSTTTAAAATGNAKPFAPKPRRLARGLNDLFAKKPVTPSAPAGDVPAPAARQEQGTDSPAVESAAAKTDAPVSNRAIAESPAPAAPAAASVVPLSASTASATLPDHASASGFEYRFVQLISRLDATCSLFSDARQTHLVAAQRSGKIAWTVAAVLAVVAGGALWWAGSLATWNQSKFEYAAARSTALEKSFNALTAQHAAISTTHEALTHQHQSLAKQHEQLMKQHDAVRSEIDAMRASLTKANLVIDQLMATPPLAEVPKPTE